GRLVNDRLGLGFEDGLANGARVEQIERDRLRAERPDTLAATWRPEGADDLVPLIDQLRDEPGADGTARPGNENSHDDSLLAGGLSPFDTARPRNVTACRAGTGSLVTSGAFCGSVVVTQGNWMM